MISNYTTTFDGLYDPHIKVAQFTLNGRMFPASRNYAKKLQELPKDLNKTIIIHYDFIYILSRFPLFREHIKKAVVKEISSLMKVAGDLGTNKVIGLVMHMDFPFRKELLTAEGADMVAKVCNPKVFDLDKISYYIKNLDEVYSDALDEFYDRLVGEFGSTEFPFKIYLENTTKVNKEALKEWSLECVHGTFQYLNRLVTVGHSDLYGLCYDTEHQFAVTGVYELPQLDGMSYIVHLNTIPSEVAPGSFKDRHSETTVFECSVNKLSEYLRIVKWLELNNIPYVREVKDEARLREQEQFIDYGRQD